MNRDHINWKLIQRYVTGRANAQERRELEDWMARSHQNRKLVQDVRTVWDQSPREQFSVDVEKAWERFRYQNQYSSRPSSRDSLPQEDSGSQPSSGHPKSGDVSLGNRSGKSHEESAHTTIYPAPATDFYSRRPGRYWIRYAAIFILAACAGLFMYTRYNPASDEGAFADELTPMALEEIVTDRGEKVRVSFSDGTNVMVNSATTIQFPKRFQADRREIYLDGEAYFEVAPNPDQPFIVHIGDVEVEVLGTEFNVRGWKEDPGIEVVVSGGSVSVRSHTVDAEEGSDVILTEGMKTKVVRGSAPGKPEQVQPLHYILWTSGGIHFDGVPMYRVIRDLERQFNVEITTSNTSLLEIPYTGTFHHASLNEILEVIATSVEMGFRRDGSVIEFYQ